MSARSGVGWMMVAVFALAVSTRAGAAAPGDPVPGAELTLASAIAIALARHPARLEEQSRVSAADERVGAARSGYLPQLLATAQYLRATDNGIGDTAYLAAPGIPRLPSNGRHDDSLSSTFDNYLAGVSAYQYLLDFGRQRGLVAQRNAEADLERARLALVELDLVYRVSKAYFDLVAAKELVAVYETAVAQRSEHLHGAQVKARAGLVSEIDAFTADSELARSQLNLVDARNAAAIAKVALDNAMGLGADAPDYRQAPPPTPPPPAEDLPAYLARALHQRPDLRMLEDEARAAGAEIAEYRSDRWPTLGATAGYTVRGHDDAAANNFDLGVVMSWPLFNGFLTDHQIGEARARQDAVRHGIEGLRQEIALQVQRAYFERQTSVQRIERADRARAASAAELDLATRRYEGGLGSILELADAQRRFTEDNADVVRAHAAAASAQAALARATADPRPRS